MCLICPNRTWQNKNISFFHFPANYELKVKWCDLLGININDLKITSTICSSHFAPTAIQQLCKKRLLRTGALPERNMKMEVDKQFHMELQKVVAEDHNYFLFLEKSRLLFVGDFKEADMQNPAKALKFFKLANKKITMQTKTLRKLKKNKKVKNGTGIGTGNAEVKKAHIILSIILQNFPSQLRQILECTMLKKKVFVPEV